LNSGFGKVGAVIVAAGVSRRMGGINKLFASLRGKPLLAWSVDTCQHCDLVDQIVLVMNVRDLARGRRLRKQRGWSKVVLCRGGVRRQDSVKEGLKRIHDSDWVIIHDAARPFLTVDLIKDGLTAARESGAAVAAVPVKDTTKLADNKRVIRETLPRDRLWAAQTPQIFRFKDTTKLADNKRVIRETLPRDRLWAAQTPQIFRFDMIARAYGSLRAEVTDDAAAVERLGYKVQLYMGDYRNIKVTTPEDLALARIIAKKWDEKT